MDIFFGAGAGFTGMVDAALDDAVCCGWLEGVPWTSEVVGLLEIATAESMLAGFFAV